MFLTAECRGRKQLEAISDCSNEKPSVPLFLEFERQIAWFQQAITLVCLCGTGITCFLFWKKLYTEPFSEVVGTVAADLQQRLTSSTNLIMSVHKKLKLKFPEMIINGEAIHCRMFGMSVRQLLTFQLHSKSKSIQAYPIYFILRSSLLNL